MEISVVVITEMRRPKELLSCLQSAISQSNVNEIVIVSDTPPEDDNIRYMCEIAAYEGVTVVFHKCENVSAAHLRSRGASVARNEYVLFLDDDTVMLTPLIVTHLVKAFPFLAFGYQDVFNVNGYTDWSPSKFSLEDFLTLKRPDFRGIRYDLRMWRRYDQDFLAMIPYGSGCVVMRRDDAIEAWEETAKIFGKDTPGEDLYASLLLAEKYGKPGLFSSQSFVYHQRMMMQGRHWNDPHPRILLEKVAAAEERYEKLTREEILVWC